MDSSLENNSSLIITDLSDQSISYERNMITEESIIKDDIPMKDLTETIEVKMPKKPRRRISFKSCYMPLCKNNTDIAQTKIFFQVPGKNRDEWIKAAGIVRKLPAGFLYICEDHLNVRGILYFIFSDDKLSLNNKQSIYKNNFINYKMCFKGFVSTLPKPTSSTANILRHD